jgi:hypothetical protein
VLCYCKGVERLESSHAAWHPRPIARTVVSSPGDPKLRCVVEEIAVVVWASTPRPLLEDLGRSDGWLSLVDIIVLTPGGAARQTDGWVGQAVGGATAVEC